MSWGVLNGQLLGVSLPDSLVQGNPAKVRE